MTQRPRFFKRKKEDKARETPQGRWVLAQRSRLKTPREPFKFPNLRFLFTPLKMLLSGLGSIFSKPGLSHLKKNVSRLASFMLLLFLFLLNNYVVKGIVRFHFIPSSLRTRIEGLFGHFYNKATAVLDKPTGSISRLDLIVLSLRNMRSKKTRTIVTVGGMAIGIGTIVFLVSVGYGLQQLVISRVARLDEMKQANVYPQTSGTVKINDKTLADIKTIKNVTMTLPLITVVGKVTYQGSESDMAVYGVTADYLRQSAIKPVEGKIFDSNNIAFALPKTAVEGASTSVYENDNAGGDMVEGGKIGAVTFSIVPGNWIRVRTNPTTGGTIIGYTKRSEGVQTGGEVWGSSYTGTPAGTMGKTASNKTLGKWITSSVLLWKQEACSQDSGDCEEGKYVVARATDGTQEQATGFFAEVNITTTGSLETKKTQVLGISTTVSDSSTLTTSGSLEFVDIASESASPVTTTVKQINLPSSSIRQAIVNRAMLQVLGIKETQAVGKTFTTSFIVVGDLLSNTTDRVESAPASYTIVGVTPDDKTPVFYVPFMDLRSLGIVNYSQLKVVTKNQADLDKVRRQIEAQGYLTRSVADTVSQINSLFATLRTVLALLGSVALAVAALGMFNTLTVSLLERTREVGLMKAMGMKSEEVKELFLTESMIMGLFGGLLGIILGFIAGKLLGLILSIFSLMKGVGFVDISYLPFPFLLLIIALSLIVGIMTGFYPARRATKISALNALRYE